MVNSGESQTGTPLCNLKFEIMSKAYIALLLLLCAGIFSCTKPDLAEDLIETQACCGEEEHNPPPPPPPPGDN